MRPLLERLEDRRLLATDLIISEFLADNVIPSGQSGYRDPNFPNDTPDWIELYNPTNSPIPLAGWKLKDSNRTWPFPSGYSVPARGYYVVFADSRNITSGTYLHTNFGLSNDGEYLGLLRPDNTIAHEYLPGFPRQDSNISYGIINQAITEELVTSASTMKGLVPTGPLPAEWNSATFNDSSWSSGQRGIGYETETVGPPAPAGWTVRMIDTSAGNLDTVAKATALLNGNTTGYTIASDTTHTIADINYVEGGRYANNRSLPNGATPATNQNNAIREQYAIRAIAHVTIPQGTYTIGVNSDDGFQLSIPGVTFTNRFGENNFFATSAPHQLTYSATRGAGDTTGTFTVGPGGLSTTITVDMFEGVGGDSLEVFVAAGARAGWSAGGGFALVADGVQGWAVKTAASTPVYTGMFGIDVRTQMLNQNGSAVLRVPFNVEDPAEFEKLVMRLKYDDGFVAYVNGQRVAGRNDPDPLAWDSNATGDHPDPQAVLDEVFEIPVTAGLLQTGVNVLAIHGLNVTDNSTDFLIAPTLDGLTPPQDVERYFGSPTPNSANVNSIIGRVGDTKFSHDRGFYEAPFQLTITTDTNNAQIRYTTDGTTPTANSTLYTGPIPINKTTTLRAFALRPGYLPTNVDTQTYIFLSDVIQQSPGSAQAAGWPTTSGTSQILDLGMDPDIVNNPLWGPNLKNDLRSIPTFSVVTELSNLFNMNGSRGIYSNPHDAGLGAERPASVELIYPDGTDGFQINAGIRIRGGYSRSEQNPKHALRFLFRPEYGDSELEYDLFKSQNGTDKFDGFDLRTFQNYSWSFDPGGGGNFIAMRDQFSRDTQYEMGHNAERGDFYHLYINGQYWGVYNTDERPEASNAANYYGGNPEDYDIIKVDPQLGYNIEATDGDMVGWSNFWNLSNQVRTLATARQVTSLTRSGSTALVTTLLPHLFSNGQTVTISGALPNESPYNITASITVTGPTTFTYTVSGSPPSPATGSISASDPDGLRKADDKLQELMGNNPDGTRNPSLPVHLDPDNLIDYMLIIFYGGNLDAPISWFLQNNDPNNWYGTWNRKTKTMGWQFFSHDAEHTLLNADENRQGPHYGIADNELLESNPQSIFERLLHSPEFRMRVQDRVHKHLFNNGALTPGLAAARLIKRRDEITRAIVAESARWGDSKSATPYTWQTWNNNVNNVLNGFIATRTGKFLNQLRTTNMNTGGAAPRVPFSIYPALTAGLEAPEFGQQNPFGGVITPGYQLALTRPSGQGTIYYSLDGTDPRMLGGGLNPSASILSLPANANGTITLNDTALVTARVRLADGRWTPLTQALFSNATPPPLRVSEIMYHPADPAPDSQFTASDHEYVEVQNISGAPLNLKGFRFTNGIDFVFPDMNLAPGARVVVAANSVAFERRYGLGQGLVGVFTGNLSNGGERITLAGRFGETIHTFQYNDNWHPHTDGEGFSLVATDTAQDVNLYGEKEGWRASANNGGDPGSNVASMATRTIAINEVAANVATPGTSWVELKNTTNQPVDISGWFLSNGLADPKKYKFPTGTILQPAGQPGSILVLNEQTSYGLGAKPFTLDPHKGDVYLSRADEAEVLLGYRELQDYNETPVGSTQGRYVRSNGAQDFPILDNPTPGAENSLPEVGPVVINEIMYGPTGNNVEWIELRNITNQSVQLFDPAFPGNPAHTWKLTEGVEFAFPVNETLAPGQFALIVGIDPQIFRTQFNIPASVKVYGPFTGFLDNAGETVRLSRPGAPYQRTTPTGTETVIPNIHVDRINYNNSAPWPVTPNGFGPSLIRIRSGDYGNDSTNWQASPQTGGSPGNINVNTIPGVNFATGIDTTLDEGGTFALAGDFADVDEGQTYTATVNWGESGANETLPLVMGADGRSGTFNFNHVFKDNGTFTVRVNVSDGASIATNTIVVEVSNVAPTATFGVANNRLEANEGLARTLQFTAPVDPSETDTAAGFRYAYDFNNDGVFEVNNTPAASIAVPSQYWADGPTSQPMRGRIIDKNGGFTEYTLTLVSRNVAPRLQGGEDISLEAPATFTSSGEYFDPGADDPHVATVDYDYHPGDADAVPLTISDAGPNDGFYTLSHVYTVPGVYKVRVTVTDQDGAVGVDEINVTVTGNDAVAPTVAESSFQYLAAPRKVSVKFSEDVFASLAPADLVITNLTTSQTIDPANVSFAWDGATNTGTWTINAALADGNYTATLASDNVSDAAGNKLDGDNSGTAGGDYTTAFFWLVGDANRDRIVNFDDLAILAQNYNTTGKDFAQGNFDGDAAGNVNFDDLALLAQRYNTGLPAPGAAAASEQTAAAVASALPFTIDEYLADPEGTLRRAREAQAGGKTTAPTPTPAPARKPVAKPAPAAKPVATIKPTPATTAATATTTASPFSSRKIAAKPVKRINDLLA